MQINVLQNKFLKVQISTLGAELRSIKNLQAQKEYLWQADPKWWGRTSPVLFPRIGYEENSCVIKHGYARDSLFDLQKKTENSLSYNLNNELIITYTLLDFSLTVEYDVITDMSFMIGAHPAFNISGLPSQLVLETQEYYLLKDGKVDFKNIFTTNKHTFEVTHETFNKNALVFKNDFSSHKVRLEDSVTVAYESEFLAIWAPPGAPFICIEPWWFTTTGLKEFQFSIHFS